MIVDKENDLVANEAMEVWRKCSVLLVGIGSCCLFGILAVGVNVNVSLTIILFHLLCLAFVLYVFVFGIGKALKEKIAIKNKKRMVCSWFLWGLMAFAGTFLSYLIAAEHPVW